MIKGEQLKRINKTKTDEFYLISFDNNELLFTGSTKNIYKIKLNDDNSLSCNCPDSTLHAKKYKVLCKHICFIYMKICKGKDHEFFERKKLLNIDVENLLINTKLLTSEKMAKQYYEKYLSMTLKNNANFDDAQKNIDDDTMCPICFDEIKNDVETKNNIKFCPACKNAMHETCINKWLETSKSFLCVYCKSNVWKNYNNDNLKNNYIKIDNL